MQIIRGGGNVSVGAVSLTDTTTTHGKLRVSDDNDWRVNVPSGLTDWFAALELARTTTTLAPVVIFGDSITEGWNATDFITDSVWALLRDNLAAEIRQGVAIDYIMPTWAKKDQATDAWTKTGTATIETSNVTGTTKNRTYGYMRLNSADTLVLPQANSGFIYGTQTTNVSNGARIIYFKDPNGGTFTVTSSDGLTLGTIDTFGETREAAVWKSAYNAPLARDYTITANDAGKTVDIAAGNGWFVNNDRAIHLYNWSRYGQLSVWGFDAFFSITAPKLTIITSVANDMNNNRSFGVYYQSVSEAVNTAIAAGSSVLLVANGNRWDDDAPLISGKRYENALRRIAEETGCAFVNVNKKWNSYADALANGYIAETDRVHPTDNGHAALSDAILECILPY